MNQFEQLQRLMDIMAQLRDPEKGCPWDLEQSFKSLVKYTLEESYELAEAIESGDDTETAKELGDLLFHLVFYAQLGKEKNIFDLEKIAQLVSDKMIFRHPHVFSDHQYASQQEFEKDWLRRKQVEKKKALNTDVPQSLMEGISTSLPAVTRALKIQQQAAHIGFDWDNITAVMAKLKEEIQELEQEIAYSCKQTPQNSKNKMAIADELGDIFFSCVNLSRHLKQDPETVLRQANFKFSQRFKKLEQRFQFDHEKMEKAPIQELEKVWQKIKDA